MIDKNYYRQKLEDIRKRNLFTKNDMSGELRISILTYLRFLSNENHSFGMATLRKIKNYVDEHESDVKETKRD